MGRFLLFFDGVEHTGWLSNELLGGLPYLTRARSRLGHCPAGEMVCRHARQERFRVQPCGSADLMLRSADSVVKRSTHTV